jgi:hypothetical protein
MKKSTAHPLPRTPTRTIIAAQGLKSEIRFMRPWIPDPSSSSSSSSARSPVSYQAALHEVDKCGIGIYVSFRANAPLRAFSDGSCSGGEKSVTTMMFLMSLQQVANCPFRVVDEINQGMDEANERMIFDQVVKTANHPSAPQYFMITPKLLTNLPYEKANDLSVTFAMSGRVMLEKFDVGSEAFLERLEDKGMSLKRKGPAAPQGASAGGGKRTRAD